MNNHQWPEGMAQRVSQSIVFAKNDTQRALGLCALHLCAMRASFGMGDMPAEMYGFALTRWPAQMDAIPEGARPARRAAVVAELARVDMEAITTRDLDAAYMVVRFLADVERKTEELMQQAKQNPNT